MLFLITYGHDFAASFAQYSSVLLNVEKSLSPSIMVSFVNTVALKAVDSSDRSYLRYEFPQYLPSW